MLLVWWLFGTFLAISEHFYKWLFFQDQNGYFYLKFTLVTLIKVKTNANSCESMFNASAIVQCHMP